MARVERVALLEREVRERLSDAAVEILLEHARVLSEGRRSNSASAGAAFFGSTMLTIDLAAVSGWVRERCDPPAARRVAALMSEDARIRRRVLDLASREGRRLSGLELRARPSDLRVRVQGVTILIDIDLEGPAVTDAGQR